MKRKMIALSFAIMVLLSIITTSLAYSTGDDYPGEYKNAALDAVVDRWNFYNRECTSFVAWCLNSRNGVAFTNQYGGVSRWGHAKTWGTVAQGLGIPVNSTPAVGAVAWWNSGTYGHVAWVSSVNGNSVTIEEYNYQYAGSFGSRVIDSWNPTGFIHIKDIAVSGILDINGLLDGSNVGTISDFGTFDIRVGSTTLTNQTDYYNSSVPAGTTYTISNIKAATGKIYNGVAAGSLSGTVQAGGSIDVRLRFDTCTDHAYGAGVVTRAATCTETGVMTYTCGKCKATKTEAIPKLEHRPVIDPAVAATVTSTGLTEGSHCSECGTVLVPQLVTDKLPRVARDFDLDGEAETVLVLPGAVKTIEAEAFAGSPAEAVMIPHGVTTIGSRAFADMPNLIAVFMPESVKSVTFDLFENSPNVTLYVQKGSRLGVRLDLPYVEIDDGWVAEDEVPIGAAIIDEKWTYTRTTVETTASTAATMEGWEQEGFTWQRTGGGTHTYASYPSGFDTGHSLYGKYAKEAISSSTSGNTKREVSASVTGYIYWHWTHNKYELSNGVYNVLIDDHYGWDAKGREFYNFRAFESTESLGHIDPNGTDGGDCFYWWGGNPEDGSWWWFRFNVNKQTYTDYEKLFTYKKTTVTQEESDSAVAEGEGISDVRHWVKYAF